MNPKDYFETDELSEEQIKMMKEAGLDGVMRFREFEVDFHSIDGRKKTVELTSGGVWIVAIGDDVDRAIFTEQNDRLLANGEHPWEIASGGVDKTQDPDIFHTINREVFEELGFRLQNLQAMAIAIKNADNESYEAISLSNKEKALWVNSNALWSQEKPVGGLICISTIPIRQLPYPFVDMSCRRFPEETVLVSLPPGVDPNEISQIALVPLKNIALGTRKDVSDNSSHRWAHSVGLSIFSKLIPMPE